MTIIELLNKIANGEEVPKKIKYINSIWEYNEETKDYNHDDLWLFYGMNSMGLTESKVEILEEENKIEKIENGKWHIEGKDGKLIMLKDKIDELIDEINKLKEDK